MSRMYFIAIVAPEDINTTILKWKQMMKERFGCVVALRSPAHITLIPPFWLDENEEHHLKNATAEFSQSRAGFEIRLKDFAAFKPRVIYVDVMPNQELQSLHAQLEEFLILKKQFSISKDERPLHPHVSIATRDLHKKAFQEAWEIFKEKKYESSWIASGISILKHDQKKWDVIFTSHFANDFVPS
ncbi:MAG: 2'-5' RNA ligase family protein [Bacteroidetes bacterium]|nr:MAG: 2'-5' RNA ligase family protein [Bacteroidota bacterium]